MGNDQLHREKRGEPKDYGKKPKTRPVKTRVLIVCEDEKTTPLYLRELCKHYRLSTAEVRICGKECKSDPDAVYNYAKDHAKNSWENGEDGFDKVYLVIDKDTHKQFIPTKKKVSENPTFSIKKQEISIHYCYSIPCIEYWFLLHFTDRSPTCSNKNSLEKSIKKEVQKCNIAYSTSHFYNALIARTKDAIDNAKKREKCAEHDEENPFTYMHYLILELQNIQKE